MARSPLSNPTVDVNSDSGSVLWSLIQGEQLEFPVQLSFIPRITEDYTFQAVVLEAEDKSTVKVGGVQTLVSVKVPPYRGAWSGTEVYYYDDVTSFGGLDWRSLSSTPRMSTMTPDLDPLWVRQESGTVFIQFPSTLGSTWATQPTVTESVLGFFELKITEPVRDFRRTWKPVRGLVEINFSPTGVLNG